MAQNTDIAVPAATWTLLTDSDVTALRVQNYGQVAVFLKATAGATPPSDTTGSISLPPDAVLAADLTLADVWPGVASATRVYAYCADAVTLSVSHA